MTHHQPLEFETSLLIKGQVHVIVYLDQPLKLSEVFGQVHVTVYLVQPLELSEVFIYRNPNRI
jgi:hypothetical protein